VRLLKNLRHTWVEYRLWRTARRRYRAWCRSEWAPLITFSVQLADNNWLPLPDGVKGVTGGSGPTRLDRAGRRHIRWHLREIEDTCIRVMRREILAERARQSSISSK
jgi:hypothetical protein